MLQVIRHLLLPAPLIWETVNDWNGDLNKQQDVFIRVGIALVDAVGSWLIWDTNPFTHALLSLSIHFLLFDYVIGMRLIGRTIEPRRGERLHWFTYMGKSGVWDNLDLWQRVGPWGRFIIKIVTFGLSLFLYVYEK